MALESVPSATPESVTVVVMAFNEEAALPSVLSELLALLNDCGRLFDVLIVDDGSTDHTGALADDWAARDARVHVIHHRPNQGLGGVYRTAFRAAQGDLVMFLPADGEIPPRVLPAFLAAAANADFVLGTLPDFDRSLRGRVLSLGERVLIRALFGALPRFQGGLLIRTAVLEQIPVTPAQGRGWMVVMELILRAARSGYRFANVPTELAPRRGGASKVRNLRTVAANLVQLAQWKVALTGRGQLAPVRPPRTREDLRRA